MAKMAIGIDGPDLGAGPDLAAVGNSARASKKSGGATQELTSFSVKRGDNGGVIVGETYEKKPPAGRRVGASFMGGGDYKENPFSPSDSAGAMAHVTDLLGQMGMSAPEPEPMPAPEAPPAPDFAAVRGPRGGGAMVAGPPAGGPDLGY